MHALTLVLVAVWCFTTALSGGLAGLVLGNIRLPALLLAASSPAAGAGANIGVSAVAVAGGLLAGALPSRALLGVIGVALLVFGVDLLRPKGTVEARARTGPDVR